MTTMKRLFLLLLISVSLCTSCKPSSDEDTRLLLLALLVVAYNMNPCNFAGTPTEASAGTTSTNNTVGSVKGKVQLTTGVPVVNALVIADTGTTSDANFWSSHTSINRDGSFLISGIPPTGTVRLAVEPLSSTFYGRIDTHIDCFLSPLSFTSGWYVSNGTAAAAASPGSGTTFAVTGGAVTNLGTITVSP